MSSRTIRLLLGVILISLGSNCLSQTPVVIDPSSRTGATVRYFGWDAKLHGNISNTPKSAKWLYSESPANIMRVPIRPRSSTPDGKVVFGKSPQDKGYGPLIDSIKVAKRVNPDIKIFASTKLLEARTFPNWMQSNRDGTIFNHAVKCPDPKKFAGLITNYFEQLAAEGIKIDFLGLNNEFGGALTPELYIATAKLLEKNLKESKISKEFKEFQYVGGEEFGVPTSVRYAKELRQTAPGKFFDIVGSHFYPDHKSGTIENWGELASQGVPNWHTEVHIRRHETARENIMALRDGMSIVFKTNQQHCEGYIYWDGTSHPGFLDNLIRRQMLTSMLYGGCVKTSGDYKAKDNEPSKRISQATRVGDTVWFWFFNPDKALPELPITLKTGAMESAEAMCFIGGRRVTPKSMTELSVKASGSSKIKLRSIPANSIAVVKIQLKDDKELIPAKSWKRVKPTEENFKASLTKVSKTTFFFKSSTGKSIRVPVKSLAPEHYDEIKDSMKAHGIF